MLSRVFSRALTTVAISDAEKAIANKLIQALKVQHVLVEDTSGGCGAMYRIELVADDFKGKSIIKQHQLVHKVLEEDISKWHGVILETKATPPRADQ